MVLWRQILNKVRVVWILWHLTQTDLNSTASLTWGLSMYHSRFPWSVSRMKYRRRNLPLFSISSMSRKPQMRFCRSTYGIVTPASSARPGASQEVCDRWRSRLEFKHGGVAAGWRHPAQNACAGIYTEHEDLVPWNTSCLTWKSPSMALSHLWGLSDSFLIRFLIPNWTDELRWVTETAC